MALPIDDDTFCARVLEHDEPVDARAAYDRFLAQRATMREPVTRYAAGLAFAAAALVVALSFTPLGTYARDFLTIFEPKAFTPIDVSSLPRSHGVRVDLRAFGTVQDQPLDAQAVAADRLDAAAGFHVLLPSYLPPHLTAGAHYEVTKRVNDAFTFSARKARAYEARYGKHLPAVPPSLDGTTVTMQLGPVVEQHWGSKSEREPQLAIVEMPAPLVRSSGATLAQLESYLLQMPDVSPELAAQIRAIGDPSSTIPVPIREDKQSAQHVRVHGTSGLAIGDNTGVGAGVMWQSHGMLYIVGGPMREDDILKIADGLQ